MIPTKSPTEEPLSVEQPTGPWITKEKALPLANRLNAIADRLANMPERLQRMLMKHRNGHGPTVLELCVIGADSTTDFQRIERHTCVWEARLSEADSSQLPAEVRAAALRMLASRKNGRRHDRKDARIVGYSGPDAEEACRNLNTPDDIGWTAIASLVGISIDHTQKMPVASLVVPAPLEPVSVNVKNPEVIAAAVAAALPVSEVPTKPQREQLAQPEAAVALDRLPTPPGAAAAPLNAVDESRLSDIDKAIAGVIRDTPGITGKQIATKVKCSPENVRKRLSKDMPLHYLGFRVPKGRKGYDPPKP